MYRILFVLFSISCLNAQEPKSIGSLLYKEVTANVETEPVFAGDDAADDMCVLENFNNPESSLIISSDKKYGIIVYDLEGVKLYDYEVGRINNVDILQSRSFQNKYIVAGTNRTYNSIDIYLFNSVGELENLILRKEIPSLKDVYGVTFYRDEFNTYLFISDKKGNVEQWSFNYDESSPEIKFERKLRFSSLVEGIVADETKGKVYIGQERRGIWELNAFPSFDSQKKLIFKKSKNFKPDFEGLTIRDDGDGNGYLIASIQGSNGYLLIDRKSLQAKTFFRIVSNELIDGTTETDGIDVSSIRTSKFPNGFFIAQDDDNDGLNQNFKLVDWNKIIK
jgi:3-phytase|tara:strand:+ start:63 stop:1070 length:1008 start_codon:yes stop_codon:yes gene_type:complete